MAQGNGINTQINFLANETLGKKIRHETHLGGVVQGEFVKTQKKFNVPEK